jgi:hypothetical protein
MSVAVPVYCRSRVARLLQIFLTVIGEKSDSGYDIYTAK